MLAGRPVSYWLSPPAILMAALACVCGHAKPAGAQSAECTPIARIVSIQGTLQIRRARQGGWSYVRKLGTGLCQGDLLHTDAGSRAALLISPETLVRLDQNSTVSISQTPEETVVEFVVDTGLPNPVLTAPNPCGAGYFITRFPRRFRVITPFVHASVEGTEFLVGMSCVSTQVAVFEGRVLAKEVLASASTGISLKNGESLTTGGGEAPAVKLVIKPIEAVQWALYYPPLSEPGPGVAPDQSCNQAGADDKARCLTVRAEQRLRVGRVNEAQLDIDASLTLARDNAGAAALSSVMSVVKNEKVRALEFGHQATQIEPTNPRAWIALSYAQQASFKLDDALTSAERAAELAPRSSTAQTRVAELLMSLGRIKSAERAAHAAVDANPSESRGHTILGFVHLAQIDSKKAREDFLAAIERDSSDPMARMGLGLAIIRDGNLVAGREQIEIAMVLDPTNSLMRSYVGKAYYEENTKERDKLAATQLGIAKKLDPNDPTPWFYDAILKDSETRPVEALEDLKRSAQLNDRRAVYRSRLLLDQDLAARNTSQGRIYNELGFPQQGLAEASSSLAIDPGSAPAHRFLADIDATLPRHEIARQSELLQAQLRQPLGAAPLQPQLANDVLFNNTLSGPATVGLNEFNPLFLRDRLELQLFGLAGTESTYGEQVILNGLRGPVSFSLSQFQAHTDGYRLNNDNAPRQYDAFIQAQLAYGTSVQFEATSAHTTSGDLQSRFDPTNFDLLGRTNNQVDTERFGMRQVIDAQSDVLLSVIHQSSQSSFFSNDPFVPVTLNVNQESWKGEVQYLTKPGHLDVIAGGSYFEGRSNEDLVTPFFSDASKFGPRHVNGYGYLYIPTQAGFPRIQLGFSYDNLTSDVGDQTTFNPKLGLIWRVADPITLRAAGFRVLKRRFASDQGLEPTQVAGFNQFFDDPNGTVADSGGIAADFILAPTVAAGLQYTHRSLSVPYFGPALNVFFQRQTEEGGGAYLYWLPSKRVAVSLQPQYQHFTRGAQFDEMELLELPLAVRVFLPAGVWFGVSVTGVGQRGQFAGLYDSDTFWLVDAVLAYRLPRRTGTISLQATNLTNQKFKFQEIDSSVLPRYVPESRVLLRVSLSF